jgi:hypothetical protein
MPSSHPQAQGFVATLFCALAIAGLAAMPVATRAAPLSKGWWVEPHTWPLFTLTIVAVAAGWQSVGWMREALSSGDRSDFAQRSAWAFGAMGSALEYSAYFCAYLVSVGYLGFALASLIYLQFVVWRAGLRGLEWRLKALLFVVILVVAFRIGIKLWFPMAPLYERFFPDWFVQSVAIYL